MTPDPNARISPISLESAPEPAKNTRSEARRGVNSHPLDPEHPPRRKRRFWLPLLAVFVLVSVGRAAWPVIDVSAVQQLIETVRLAQDQLDRVTTTRDALLGQVANFTGVWDDLTGAAYELGEQATGTVSTVRSLADIDTHLVTRRNAENNAWPTDADVRSAYAGSPAAVITQVLRAHQAGSRQWNDQRAAWRDSQILLAATGEFLEAVETTASNQNAETDAGLSAQLDRHIAVSSAARDIAARQLEIAAAGEHRAAQLEHLEALYRARQIEQALEVRTEINTSIDTLQAGFDDDAFDDSLYAPVLPSYTP